jgi:hypothetical protein
MAPPKVNRTIGRDENDANTPKPGGIGVGDCGYAGTSSVVLLAGFCGGDKPKKVSIVSDPIEGSSKAIVSDGLLR